MTETRTNETILVGVDGSDSSIDALRQAARIATALDAPLAAITVWDYPAMVEYYPIPDWSPEDDARRTLTAAIEQAFDGAPPARLKTSVAQGPVARTLIAQSKQAGMLVLGSRGHGGFVGMLIGSVSSACAEHAHCPVLVVHSPRSASTAPADVEADTDATMELQGQK